MDRNLSRLYLAIPLALLSIIGAYFEWDWFFNDRKVKFLVRVLGRKGAKIFYFLFGLGIYGWVSWLISNGDFTILAIFAGILLLVFGGMFLVKRRITTARARRAIALED